MSEFRASIRILDWLPASDSLSTVHSSSQPPFQKRLRDAEHIALAAIHQVTYLVTWNFRHIANPVTAGKIDAVLRLLGYTPSVLCSPEQLLADN